MGLYDVAIIGLGPAGSTLARLLPTTLSVIAIDKKAAMNDGGFHKPCGGLLAPDAQKALSKFNLTLPKSVLVDPQIFAVRTLDTRFSLERYYQRFYMNIDRHKFDQWLISLIPDSVERVEQAAVTEVARVDGGFEIVYKTGTSVSRAQARYVVGADGAQSVVRRKLFPHSKTRAYVALQEWYVDENTRPLYSCFFDSDITDCYAWSISKDGKLVVGGAFPAVDCKHRFEALKQKLARQGYVLGEPILQEACGVLRPRGYFDFCAGKDGAYLIGEAAGLISPSSLEGISYAMDSAAMLADALERPYKNPNRAYDHRMRTMRLKLLLKNVKSVFMYTPWLRYLVMRSGIQGIQLTQKTGG